MNRQVIQVRVNKEDLLFKSLQIVVQRVQREIDKDVIFTAAQEQTHPPPMDAKMEPKEKTIKHI